MRSSANHHYCQSPGLPIVPVLSLLLGLCLQPLLSSTVAADVASAPVGQATESRQRSNTSPVLQQPVLQQQVAPTTAAPRKQARSTTRKSNSNGQMRQALKQVAGELEAERRSRQLTELLARAQLDYTEGRLFEPANNNALARYQEILTWDPAQPQALAATQRITDVIAAEAEHAALAGDQARTLQYIVQIRALQPKHAALLGLDARYQALVASPVVLSARQQDRYNRSARRIDEAYYILRNQPLGLSSIDKVVGEYDRAAALVTQAPGLPKLKDRILLALPEATRAELTADAPRRALRVVQLARRRGWFTEELGLLEEQARNDINANGLFSSPMQQR